MGNHKQNKPFIHSLPHVSNRIYSAKATVTTMNASFGGGFVGLAACYVLFGGKIFVPYISNSVLGSLVSITCSSFLMPTWTAFLTGKFSYWATSEFCE